MGFYRIKWEIMRFNKSLQKSKVSKSYNIPQHFLHKITHFNSLSFNCNVLCWLLLSLLVILKYYCRISVLQGYFQNFELSNLPIIKFKKSISQILRGITTFNRILILNCGGEKASKNVAIITLFLIEVSWKTTKLIS